MSRDKQKLLFRGRWGLYNHLLATGETRLLYYQHPFAPNELVDFSFTPDAAAGIAIRCSDWEPEMSGVYTFPLDGGPSVRQLVDEGCGPRLLNYFQTHRREIAVPPRNIPAREQPVSPPRFPGTLWRVDVEGKPALAVWGNGAAGHDTLCTDCQGEFASWHPSGGDVLLATGPINVMDPVSPGALWLLKPGREAQQLGVGRFDAALWPDSTLAFVIVRPGNIETVDTEEGTVRPLDLSMTPRWLRERPLSPAQVWTVRLQGPVFAVRDSARAVALRTGLEGYATDPVGEAGSGGWTMTVGAFGDEASAQAAAKRLRAAGNIPGLADCPVERRPVSTMLGAFEFGGLDSPDGKHRVVFRTHPHMFQPYISTEVLLEPKGGRRRVLLDGLATF